MRSPITTERQNIQLLRDSGFTQQQAEAVATVVENAIQSGFEKFSEVLSRELGAIRNEISALRSEVRAEIAEVRSELRIEIRDSRVDIQKSLNDQAWKIVASVTAIVGIGVAIIKLFPNAGG